MMQVLNYTALPTAALRPVLAEAARQVGARTSGVLVTLSWRPWGFSGRAHCNTVRAWCAVPGKRVTKVYRGPHTTVRVKRAAHRYYPCQGKIVLGVPRDVSDGLTWAEGLYRLALHEFAHIADSQRGRPFADYRLPWGERIHEISANEQRQAALGRMNLRRQEVLLNLGLAIDAYADQLTRKRLRRAAKERGSIRASSACSARRASSGSARCPNWSSRAS